MSLQEAKDCLRKKMQGEHPKQVVCKEERRHMHWISYK